MESLFIVAILFFLFYFSFVKVKNKGVRGEAKVASKLRRLNKNEYIVLNNVLLKTPNRSSQIDHVVVSVYGIFVIETKNYKGWIHGHENSEYWTQTIYKHKNRFLNPITQNMSHIHALKKVLSEYKNIKYHSIVVFVGSAVFKNVYVSTSVVYGNQLISKINENSETKIFSEVQIKKTSNVILNSKSYDKNDIKEHKYNVHRRTSEREEQKELLRCPKCNSVLVIRNGPYGQFLGCSNYPRCKFSSNV